MIISPLIRLNSVACHHRGNTGSGVCLVLELPPLLERTLRVTACTRGRGYAVTWLLLLLRSRVWPGSVVLIVGLAALITVVFAGVIALLALPMGKQRQSYALKMVSSFERFVAVLAGGGPVHDEVEAERADHSTRRLGNASASNLVGGGS